MPQKSRLSAQYDPVDQFVHAAHIRLAVIRQAVHQLVQEPGQQRHLGIAIGVPCCDSTVSTCQEEAIVASTLIALTSAASGAAVNWLTGTSPLTVRIHDEVMRGVASMGAAEVEPIIHSTLDLLGRIQKEHEGQQCPFTDQLFFAIYDLQALQPKPEYRAAVERSVAMMREAGVPLSDALKLD